MKSNRISIAASLGAVAGIALSGCSAGDGGGTVDPNGSAGAGGSQFAGTGGSRLAGTGGMPLTGAGGRPAGSGGFASSGSGSGSGPGGASPTGSGGSPLNASGGSESAGGLGGGTGAATGVCEGATPHGCYKPQTANAAACPPQIPEQAEGYVVPLNQWTNCGVGGTNCIYDKPAGGTGNCVCDTGVHWACFY